MNKLRLRSMLIIHEGWQREPYMDTEGHKTIGVGRNLDSNPLPPYMQLFLSHHGCLEDSMIDTLLQQDIDLAILNCRALYYEYDKLPDGVQIALADFMFNVGPHTATEFIKMIANVVKKDWNGVADEMMDSKWASQVKGRADDLCSMIRKEADGDTPKL